MGRIQLAHFNLNGMIQRESELKSKYQDCVEDLKQKDATLQSFKVRTAENSAIDVELSTLREKVLSGLFVDDPSLEIGVGFDKGVMFGLCDSCSSSLKPLCPLLLRMKNPLSL